MEKLIQQITYGKTLSADLLNDMDTHFRQEIAPKNKLLLKEKQYCRRLYFLEKGTVRTFYYAKEKDVTSWFYQEGQFFTAWYSFYSEQPSFEYIETLEDCSLYIIDHYNYNQLLEKHHDFARFGRKLAEGMTAYIDQYSKGYMFLSAKERYDLLLASFPDITQRVNLGHIASFLGITQETLSRIRKQK